MRRPFFRRFLATFALLLIVVAAGLACCIADINTHRISFGNAPLDPAASEELIVFSDQWTDVLQWLPAPARLWGWIPYWLGRLLPREWDEEAYSPRFSQ